jgi:hypothetical protein
MPSPNLSELVTTTLRHRAGKLRDAVTINSALMMRLKEKGRVQPVSGGRTIVEELEYAENSTYTRYSGYEPLNIQPSDVLTAAEYSWKQAAMAVTMSGLEERINSGKAAVIDLLESRIKNAEKSFINNLTRDMYSDGSATNQIGGLRSLVSDAGTGTVGGINSSTWSFWRSQLVSFAGETLTPGSDTIQEAMNKLFVKLIRNRDKVDLIVADNVYWLYYLESLQPIQRITNSKLADAGFENLKYMGADVVLDGGLNGAAPSAHMYFLNTDYLGWRPHSKMNMDPLGDDRQPVNQDAMIKLIGWQGNMTVSNRMLQGVLVA